MPKIRQNAAPEVSCQDRAKAEQHPAALEHDHRGDEGEPGPQPQVEQHRGEAAEHEQQDRPGLGVGRSPTSQATGSPMSTAMMRRAPTTVTSTAPAIAEQPALGAVPGLADADLAADDGLADDVGEEAGQGDRGDDRADGRQVVADQPVEPEAVARRSTVVSWLATQAPRAVVGTRQTREVTTARPMVAATFPRIALVTAP